MVLISKKEIPEYYVLLELDILSPFFLAVVFILLLNLLIAMMGDTYTKVERKDLDMHFNKSDKIDRIFNDIISWKNE